MFTIYRQLLFLEALVITGPIYIELPLFLGYRVSPSIEFIEKSCKLYGLFIC